MFGKLGGSNKDNIIKTESIPEKKKYEKDVNVR
jgi:hypothetical protein